MKLLVVYIHVHIMKLPVVCLCNDRDVIILLAVFALVMPLLTTVWRFRGHCGDRVPAGEAAPGAGGGRGDRGIDPRAGGRRPQRARRRRVRRAVFCRHR